MLPNGSGCTVVFVGVRGQPRHVPASRQKLVTYTSHSPPRKKHLDVHEDSKDVDVHVQGLLEERNRLTAC